MSYVHQKIGDILGLGSVVVDAGGGKPIPLRMAFVREDLAISATTPGLKTCVVFQDFW